MYRIGIDLGGTNTAAGLVADGGRIIDRATVKTNLPTTIEKIVSNLLQLVDLLLARNRLTIGDITSMGIGVPCTADKESGCIKDADHLGFAQGQLVAPLKEALSIPIFIENDANAAALGEFEGGGYGGNAFVLVTLGTGIGGGIILDRRLVTGCNHTAGELGHMVIDLHGEPCGCGRRGCFEAYGSATALVRQASAALDQKIGDAKTVFDLAAAGNDIARQVLDRYTTYLAEGFANIINLLAPDWLCIGGGVSAAGNALLEPVRQKTYARILSKNAQKNTRIILAKLHNDAGILGAALLDN